MRARLAAVIAVISILAGLGQAAASDQQFNPPKRYYLALGDSISYGYSQALFNANFPTESPSAFEAARSRSKRASPSRCASRARSPRRTRTA